MKTRTALRIDHYVGTILCWAMSLAVRTVGILFRRNHRPPYAPERILFIKLMGAGSVVQALPAMAGLRNCFPDASIRMLCFPDTAGFAKRLAFLEKTYTVNNASVLALAASCFKVLLALLCWRPHLVIDLEYHSKFSSLLAALTMAQNRAGLFDVSTRFRDYLYTHLVYANPRQHIADLYIQVVRIFGVTSVPSLEESMSQLQITAHEEGALNTFLHAHEISPDTPLLVLNPNAGDLCLERRWPVDRFGQIAAALVSSGKVILVGSPKEQAYVESVRETVPDPARSHVINAAGALSYGAYLALLRKASLVITNDSGPMHFAAAFGTPTVSLWGPGAPQHYEPRTSKHVAVWARLFCSPCLYVAETPPCRGNNACMEAISVSDVLTAAKALCPGILTEVSAPPLSTPPPDRLLGVLMRDFDVSTRPQQQKKRFRARLFNQSTVLRIALLGGIVLALIKWAAPALHLLPMRAEIISARATASHDPQDPYQDYSAARLYDNSMEEGIPNDGWVLPRGRLGSAQLTWRHPLRVREVQLLNICAMGGSDKCSAALDGHSLGVFPVNLYPEWTRLIFDGEPSPPVTSLTIQVVSARFDYAGLNEVRVWGYPVEGRVILLAKALASAAVLALLFIFAPNVQARLPRCSMPVSIAIIIYLLILLYIIMQQIFYVKVLADSVSHIADGFSESNAVRGGESFADLGFFKYAGLPDICYGDTWKQEGFPVHIVINGRKTEGGYLIPSSKAPVTPDHYVYTHYPPGPEWITGLVTTLFGKRRFALLRAAPITFGLLAAAVFARFLWRQAGPGLSAAVMVLLAATPMFTNMMHGLHYQSYAQSLLLLQIAVLGSLFSDTQTRRPTRFILLFLLAFAQGYMSFDYCFLVTFAAVPVFCFAGSTCPVKKGVMRLGWAVAVAGAGFCLAHAVHFAQVAVYYGSLSEALDDFVGAAGYRIETTPLVTLADKYGRQFLYDGRFFYPFSLWVEAAALIVFAVEAAARAARADLPNRGGIPLVWRVGGVLSALFVCSGWIIVMRQHAMIHGHFLPRHFFLLYLCLILFVVNAYTAPHARKTGKACEVNQP
ncbi:MAG: glycosyltransferase family 9 protein [Candidatus Hydrogenedentes bacterium]|nr:glycosyltransferase family 9 protein [Candidatus Hydrogenedentota bacterium]